MKMRIAAGVCNARNVASIGKRGGAAPAKKSNALRQAHNIKRPYQAAKQHGAQRDKHQHRAGGNISIAAVARQQHGSISVTRDETAASSSMKRSGSRGGGTSERRRWRGCRRGQRSCTAPAARSSRSSLQHHQRSRISSIAALGNR